MAEEKGHWVTINGTHVFIDESGQVTGSLGEKIGKKHHYKLSEAYKLGELMRQDGITNMRAATDSNEYWEELQYLDEFQLVAVEAAIKDKEEPYYVEGWRYGRVPKSGFSWNTREGIKEMGVSVMELDTGEETQDYISALFISANKPKVRVGGYLNTVHRGGDGEPLLMYAKEIQTIKL